MGSLLGFGSQRCQSANEAAQSIQGSLESLPCRLAIIHRTVGAICIRHGLGGVEQSGQLCDEGSSGPQRGGIGWAAPPVILVAGVDPDVNRVATTIGHLPRCRHGGYSWASAAGGGAGTCS